ncbi:hypothetical protein ACIBTV_27365 [Micromonospora sp. NPDC049366]|uniref:hypothetical protein n=1 Tax=Micromonospora sp. NPDC049366 TaxID=3364271 RepID=UPI0037974125
MARELWIGGRFVVEWDLGTVTDAVVAGAVQRPGTDTPAAMTVEHQDGTSVWRASYVPPAAGTYGYRITAQVDGQPADATGGTFVVSRDTTGAEPITLDTAEPVGRVRLLITDTDEAFPLFTDAQLGALLAMEGDNVKRGAAAALETIAVSETLIGKKITTQDLSTDGPAVAKALQDRARALREQADGEAGAVADPYAYGFDFVDMPAVGTHPGVDW